MHKITQLMAGAGLAVLFTVSAPVVRANGVMESQETAACLHKPLNRFAPQSNVFKNSRTERIHAINKKLTDAAAQANPAKYAKYRVTANLLADENIKPDVSTGPVSMFADLDGPNGELWYYTMDIWSSVIEHEYYNEYILQEYKFEIYDSNMEHVGTIHDKMRYAADEVRVPGPINGIDILPVITKNFFNDDDKYEIAVQVAVNSTTPGHNHYRTLIYSIDGEKETVEISINGNKRQVEVDKIVATYNSFIADVLDASTPEKEQMFITFGGERYSGISYDFNKLIPDENGNVDPVEGEKYWQSINNSGPAYTMYSGVGADGKLKKVHEFQVSYQTWQGDQESSFPMFTFSRDGKAYAVCPHYKESFFMPYYSPYQDMTMRENNALVIDLYQLSETGSTLVQSTEIPVTKQDSSGVLATFYSVGDLRYSDDVIFNANGTVSFVITRCNYTVGSSSTLGFCYYIYNYRGKLSKTIFEFADSQLALTPVPGKNPMHLFVSYDEGYVYNFVDLVTGYDKKKTVKINYLFKIDPEDTEDEGDVLMANVDVVPVGDTWKYAFEMRVPTVDDEENDVLRVAWFNADGSFDRIDYINMGKNVYYAMPYIDGKILNPELTVAGEEQEYWILIKRGIDATGSSSASQEEFIIGQPESDDYPLGRTLLHLTPCEKGTIALVSLDSNSDNEHKLGVTYTKGESKYVDFYNLPLQLETGGVDHVAVDSKNTAIKFDGASLYAPGQQIKVFSTQGSMLLSGNESVEVSHLTPGVYVAATATDVIKIIVK